MMIRRRVPIPRQFHELKMEGEQYFGRSGVHDCWIVAASLATGIPYSQLADLITKDKWDPERGAVNAHVRSVLKKVGFHVIEVTQRSIIHRYPASKQSKTFVTPRQVARFPSSWRHLPPLLLYTHGHVACVKAGAVADWTASSSLRVFRIDAVIPVTEDSSKFLASYGLEKA